MAVTVQQRGESMVCLVTVQPLVNYMSQFGLLLFIIYIIVSNSINKPYRDAQDRLLWTDKTCPAHT